ncbi:hypothetical protein CsatA_006955 [Cannabis sativa]
MALEEICSHGEDGVTLPTLFSILTSHASLHLHPATDQLLFTSTRTTPHSISDRRKSNKLVNVEDVPSDVQPEENESSQQDSLPEKSPVKKDKSSDMDSESDDSSTQKIDEKADNIMEFTPRKPR